MTACETIQIDSEFQGLIPPLSAEERSQLEANLLKDGCIDPLIVWEGKLLDGHNRHAICRKHGIGFGVKEIALKDRSEALAWIIRHQFGRRNLTPFQRSELALRLEPLIAAKAKANQKMSGGAVPQKSAEPVETRTQLAALAGIWRRPTIDETKIIAAEVKGEVCFGVVELLSARQPTE